MLQGLIMDMPLMISSAIQHAAAFHDATEIVARDVDGTLHRYTYAEAHRRTKRLAGALGRLGVRPGDRIGTLGWNTHRHFELFYGVSGSGAVVHPVNPRLFADQIVYIINHAEDAWLFIDAATLPLAEQLAPRLKSVQGFVLMAERSAMPDRTTLGTLLCYEDLLAAESDDYVWPQLDERSASSICYTSGTTGNPKGVVYSHRSSVLVSMLFTEWVYRGGRNGAAETLMSLAPLFHANGWYFPYVAPMTGSKLVLPGRNYEPAKLYELFDGERVTITCGVPTMWLTLIDWMEREGRTLSHLRAVYSAGTAAPRSLLEKFAAWGIDPEGAVQETIRARRDGCVGIFLSPDLAARGGRHFDDPAFRHFWETAQELEMPIAFHVVVRDHQWFRQWQRRDPSDGLFGFALLAIDVMAAFTQMLSSGMFERYPRLKCAVLEAGSNWIVAWLDRLDHKYRVMAHQTPIRMEPSAYFRRQCLISADPDESVTAQMVEHLGADYFIWASDYPHIDASFGVVRELKERLAPLSEDARRKVLGENAQRFYRLAG